MDEKRLAQFEKMLSAVQTEIEDLKEKGKIRSVTYQQLLARKMTCRHLLSMYQLYDLIEK